MSKSINLFAVESDMKLLLLELESVISIKYVRAGISDEPLVEIFTSVSEIPGLGEAHSPDQAQCPIFLILPSNTTVNVEPIEQRRGGVRYALDQRKNSASLALRLGGVFAECCVIAGQVGTCSDDPNSVELMRVVTRLTTKHFKRIRSYFVGPGAKELMEQGYRLTADARMPKEYDLALS